MIDEIIANYYEFNNDNKNNNDIKGKEERCMIIKNKKGGCRGVIYIKICMCYIRVTTKRETTYFMLKK